MNLTKRNSIPLLIDMLLLCYNLMHQQVVPSISTFGILELSMRKIVASTTTPVLWLKIIQVCMFYHVTMCSRSRTTGKSQNGCLRLSSGLWGGLSWNICPRCKTLCGRSTLDLVTALNLLLYYADVFNVFLDGYLDDAIYKEVPAEFKDSYRPLYDLKQALRQWYARILEFSGINCTLRVVNMNSSWTSKIQETLL